MNYNQLRLSQLKCWQQALPHLHGSFPCPCAAVSPMGTKANYKSKGIQNYLRWRWMTVTCPTLPLPCGESTPQEGEAFHSLTSLFVWSVLPNPSLVYYESTEGERFRRLGKDAGLLLLPLPFTSLPSYSNFLSFSDFQL